MNTFPTGIKDLDLQLLSTIGSDRDLLNTLSVKNKTILKYANDESLWRNRFKQKYPQDFDYVRSILTGSWKKFYLSLITYLEGGINYLKKFPQATSKHLIIYDKAMQLAAEDNNFDLVNYFFFKGV